MTTEDVDKWIKEDPPRRHEPEQSENGFVRTAVSQPLPVPTLEEMEDATFVLGDFGTGKRRTICQRLGRALIMRI